MPADYYRKHRPISNAEASRLRELAVRGGQNIVLVDPVEDEKWARQWRDVKRPSDYFEYFFSGQDIRVRVAEIPENDTRFGDIPIAQLQFQVEQEKQPIYGFWDYTYSAVMRGTRLVSGQFAIFTKYPNYMMDLLSQAATNRASGTQIDNYGYTPGLTEDDKQIEQYWGRNLFDAGIQAQAGRHMFSVHPPFSLVIQYGLQPMSVPKEGTTAYEQWYVDYYESRENEMFTDINHRLLKDSDPSLENRLILDGVELRACSRQYMGDGAPLGEVYSFFARDIIVPTPPKPNSSTGGEVKAQVSPPTPPVKYRTPTDPNNPLTPSPGGPAVPGF
jgi:hypothetical protein